MKIIINQSDLLSAINIAQKAVSNSNMQILSGILIVAENNMLTLMTTDFDISIETKVPCTVIENGSFVVSSSLFGDIVRKLSNKPINIEKDGDNIIITCGDAVYNLSTLDATEFPSMPFVDSSDKFSISESVLSDSIDYTIFSISIDDTKPILRGVLIESDGNLVNFASLDGYRLSRFRLNIPSPKMKIIVPGKSLGELRKILKEDDQVMISAVDSHALFEFGNTKFYTKLLEGEFVDYNQLMDTNLKNEAIIDRKNLEIAIERISLLAMEDKARLVKMKIGNDIIEFESNSEIGRGYEKISCQYSGEPMVIAFNNRYILDGVKAIKTKDLKMSLASSISPAILEPIDGEYDYNYLVLPVKLKSDD